MFVATTLWLLPLLSTAFVLPTTHSGRHQSPEITRQAMVVSSSTEMNTKIGIIICDHGSRRAAANDMLAEVAARFKQAGGADGSSSASSAACAVEIAHMELAEPTIEDAFGKCVAAGATAVVCHPFFLSPGRHVTSDIPALLTEAAAKHPGVKWVLSEPLGLAPLMPQLMHDTVAMALEKGQWQESAPAVAMAEVATS